MQPLSLLGLFAPLPGLTVIFGALLIVLFARDTQKGAGQPLETLKRGRSIRLLRPLKAAVTMRCLSNFLSFYGTSDIGPWFGERELAGSPRDQMARYWELSPLAHVENVQTPILILHGEQDLRCPQEQAEQWFVSLRRLGKTAEFVRFPDESHDLSRSGRPDRRLLRLGRIVEWFDRYLGAE
jgi:dipeptidyl aminopeptidase/acylaminoacyl peptidase